jgi:hypothetical protein
MSYGEDDETRPSYDRGFADGGSGGSYKPPSSDSAQVQAYENGYAKGQKGAGGG